MSQQPHQFQPQGPAAYANQPPGPPEQTLPQKPPKNRNLVAIVAFIVAIAGFVFAVMEGAYVLGWVLLPIGFILSLVALFLKGQPKRMAVAALIITIVGTIAGVVAFMSSAARAFDDAFSSGEITAAPAEPGTIETLEDTDGSANQGTRANPFPLGTTISNAEWEVTVNSVDLEAAKKVAAESEFNDEPDEGYTYALVNLTVAYVGEHSGSPSSVRVNYVTGSGNVIDDWEKFVRVPDELNTNELYPGATTTGNIHFHVPLDDDGVLRVAPGLFADEVFFVIN